MSENVTIKNLDNGFRVVYIDFPGIDSATFRLIGRVGAMWENAEELGIAHYIEHLAFDGTKKYPNPDNFRGLIEDVGGRVNAYTNFLEANYMVKVIKEEIERAFEFLSQQVIHPLFKEEDIEKQRTIIMQEYNMYRDDPVSNFLINSQKHIFSDKSRLQHPLIGTDETLKTINRAQIKKYFERNYHAHNLVLGVCGDGIENKVMELAKQYFSPMKKEDKNKYLNGHYENKQSVYTENNNQIKQATISVVFGAPLKYDQERFSAKYVQKILGGGLMSRLFKEIRQKRGLAYNVKAKYNYEVSYSIQDIIAQVDPKNVEKVIKLIKAEVEKIVEEGITQKEYERAKKSIASNFVFNNESPGSRAQINAKLVLEGHKEHTYDYELDKYMSVGLEEVNKAAKKIYSHQPKLRVLSNKITDKEVLNAWNS